MGQTSTAVGLGLDLEEGRATSLRIANLKRHELFRCIQTTRWVASRFSWGSLNLLSTAPALGEPKGNRNTDILTWKPQGQRTSSPLLFSHRMDPRPTAGWLAMFVF